MVASSSILTGSDTGEVGAAGARAEERRDTPSSAVRHQKARLALGRSRRPNGEGPPESASEVSLVLPPSLHVVGDVVADKYRLEIEIGNGGMGTVWVATNTTLDTQVAIKLMRGVGIVGATQRMLREARAAAPLRHPAIVRVFDFGVAPGGHAYIVMELLEGESLTSLLAREGRLAPERAVQLLLPVAEGLAVAHAHGVVHRDLKPDNVFLATDDSGRVQPKIVDFGIAKILRPSSGPGLTGVTVIGTPQYMSPEQAIGDEVDERADVWALSVVLHELITNEYVFDGANVEAVMSAVVTAPAASLVEKAGVDQALWSIVERGLQKDRDARWATVSEMARALATWLLDHGIEEDVTGASIRPHWLELPTPPRPQRRSTPLTVAGIGPRLPWKQADATAETLALPPAETRVPRAWALGHVLRGRAARLMAIAGAAATLIFLLGARLRGVAVADEAVGGRLRVGAAEHIAQRAMSHARLPEAVVELAPPEQAPSPAPSSEASTSAPTASTSAPRSLGAPARKPTRQVVDFGF